MGPITGVSCYSQMSADINLSDSYAKNSYLSQLFLTSSFDGCIKLWNLAVSFLESKEIIQNSE